MPARKQPHEFTACEQFGTRYSALGKRIEASVPKGETAVTRTYTSELDIFQLCDNLAVELEDPEAELEYIAQNRKNYYNTHSYMKDKAIGTAYDGPVFPDDIIYRRSSGEKYTVQADGSITTAAGRTYKAPDFQNFIHTFPKKGAAKKEAAPVLTLPKQDNPLVEGECKTRTPEEASRSAAKQREQARKEAAKTTAPESEDERIIEGFYTLIRGIRRDGGLTLNKVPLDKCEAWLEKQRINTDGDFARGYDCGYECCLNSHGAEWFEKQKEQKPEEWSEEEEQLLNTWLFIIDENEWRMDANFCEDTREFIARLKSLRPQPKQEWSEDIIQKAVKEVGLTQHQIDWFKTNVFPPKQGWGDKELAEACRKRGITSVLADIPTDDLVKEIERRPAEDTLEPTPLEKLLRRRDAKELYDSADTWDLLENYEDTDLVDKLRERGCEVTATKTINL